MHCYLKPPDVIPVLIRFNYDANAKLEYSLGVRSLLPGMQTQPSDEKAVCFSVCLSVRLSNAWIVIKRKKHLSRFLYHTKDQLAYSFLRRMVGGEGKLGNPFHLKFWVNQPPLERNRRFWTDIRSFARSALAVTPSKKVQLTLTGSPLCAFQWA